MPGTRTLAAGRVALQLDGQPCGFLDAVNGGDVSADVIIEPAGASGFAKKHIGQPKYEDLELQIGLSMGNDMYEWIRASWSQNYSRKDGSIVITDPKLAPVAELQFKNALITETTIPALDASSKDPAYLTVKVAPEYTRKTKPAGKAGKLAANKQKLFTAANFKVDIAGLDCSKVSKVEAFTIRQAVVTDNIGDARDYVREPGKLEFPNLKITFPETIAQTWEAWFEDFVIKGNNGDASEKEGTLVFLTPNRKAELAQITLHNLGIFALRRGPIANDAAVRRMTAELYCERMELKVGAG